MRFLIVRQGTYNLSRSERFFILAALCLSAGVSLVSTDEGDVVTGPAVAGFNLTSFLIQWTIFGLLFSFCYLHRRAVLQNLRYLRGPLPLVILTVTSTLWSVDPTVTGKRSGVLLLQTLLGYYLGATLDPDELSLLYAQALEIMILLSLTVIFLLPSYGISHGVHTGDWRGAFYHKNEAGEIMALALMTFGIVPPRHLSPIRRWGMAALSLLLLYKSNASSSIISIAFVIAIQAIWALLMFKRKVFVGMLLAGYPLVVFAALLIIEHSASVFRLVGKDSSFNGRDRVWRGVLDGVAERPWFGYGFLAFWSPRAGELVLVAEKTTFVPNHAHNGYLNLLLHVGIVGMVLFLIFLSRLFWLTVREGRRTDGSTARWFFSFLTLIVVVNVTESHFLESAFFWISLVAFFISFSRQRNKGLERAHEPAILSQSIEAVLGS